MLGDIILIAVVILLILIFVPGEKIAAAQKSVQKWVEKLKSKL